MFFGRSVGMWLLFKVGFWETGTWVRVLILVLGALGFESITLFFGGVVGLSPHLGGGGGGVVGCGFESTSLFFFKFCFVWVVVVVLL